MVEWLCVRLPLNVRFSTIAYTRYCKLLESCRGIPAAIYYWPDGNRMPNQVNYYQTRWEDYTIYYCSSVIFSFVYEIARVFPNEFSLLLLLFLFPQYHPKGFVNKCSWRTWRRFQSGNVTFLTFVNKYLSPLCIIVIRYARTHFFFLTRGFYAPSSRVFNVFTSVCGYIEKKRALHFLPRERVNIKNQPELSASW